MILILNADSGRFSGFERGIYFLEILTTRNNKLQQMILQQVSAVDFLIGIHVVFRWIDASNT